MNGKKFVMLAFYCHCRTLHWYLWLFYLLGFVRGLKLYKQTP